MQSFADQKPVKASHGRENPGHAAGGKLFPGEVFQEIADGLFFDTSGLTDPTAGEEGAILRKIKLVGVNGVLRDPLFEPEKVEVLPVLSLPDVLA